MDIAEQISHIERLLAARGRDSLPCRGLGSTATYLEARLAELRTLQRLMEGR